MEILSLCTWKTSKSSFCCGELNFSLKWSMDATAFFGFVEKVLIHFEERGKVKMSINHLRGNSSFRSSNSSSGSSSFRSYSWYQFKCIWRVLIRTLISRTELTSNEYEKNSVSTFQFLWISVLMLVLELMVRHSTPVRVCVCSCIWSSSVLYITRPAH